MWKGEKPHNNGRCVTAGKPAYSAVAPLSASLSVIETLREHQRTGSPMPHDGSCFKPGNPSNALPPPCPIPNLKLICLIHTQLKFAIALLAKNIPWKCQKTATSSTAAKNKG